MRKLRQLGLIKQKGKGRGTYYIPSKEITTEALAQTTEAHAQTKEGIHKEIPKRLMDQINDLSSKERDKEKVNRLILQYVQYVLIGLQNYLNFLKGIMITSVETTYNHL